MKAGSALRSFVEEMLGYSIDLTDNRVLDYIDQPGSPPATVAKLSAAPLAEPVADVLAALTTGSMFLWRFPRILARRQKDLDAKHA